MGLIFPIYLYRKLKNLLVRNQWTDFSITWQECFFGDPLPRLFKLSWSSKNMAATGQGLFFPICLYKKLKKSSRKKPLDQAQCSLARMLLLWPSTRMVQAFMICQKTWPPGGGAYFRYISVKKTLKCFLSNTSWPILIMLWWPSTKNVQAILICQKKKKTWLLVDGAYFPSISK